MDGQNVLIVENDAAVSELITGVLSAAGYRPVAIAHHALITETVERWRPRCVLLEGEVASTTGGRSWRDAAFIRWAHPAIPVVLVTGDASAVAEARAGRSYRSRAARFAGIIGRPPVAEELLATVKTVVDSSTDTDVLAAIAHQMREPLRAIRDEVRSAPRSLGMDPEGGQRILAQTDRIDRLIEKLLDSADDP